MISEARKRDSGLIGWKCSSWAELITSIENGWVEWLTTETERGTMLHGLRLVHKETKQSNSGAHSCRCDPRAEFRMDQTLSRVCRSKVYGGVKFFTEARYHYADTGRILTRMVPVTVGINLTPEFWHKQH
jgi:hypothetical protein